MDTLVANQLNNTSSLEVSNIDGRWCIKSSTDRLSSFEGLLVTSGSDVGSRMEPLSAIPLNDELQHAKALVADAETEVLLELTAKMQSNLDNTENLLENMIQLDMIRWRRLNEEYINKKEETIIDLPSLQLIVTELEEACPIAVDFLIAKKTRVLLVSGSNMGGKTICLKTVGLAAMMTKSGLYILCSEQAQTPWFDFVFADIVDEQSLS